MTSAVKKTGKLKAKKAPAKKAAVKADVGSSQAQVTLMTSRINELNEHLKNSPKDHMARRGLLQLVGKRRRLLTYLARHDEKAYLATVKKLGLRH